MATVTATLSPAEYLAAERLAATRNEYIGGETRPRHGSNLRHNLLVTALVSTFDRLIVGKPLEGYVYDMRVRVPDGPYYYPDAVVAPSPPELEDEHQDTLLNPLVVVEVLSPTTEAIDRGEKLDNYRRIPTLADYLIVAQDRLRIDHYSRLSADEWRLVYYDGPNAVIPLATLACDLSLSDIYARWLAERSRS